MKYYNILDTETMIEPISNLIKKNRKLKVDMLQNLSYSSCASAEKYAFAYDKFNIKNDYQSIRKTTFKLEISYWKTKVDNYKKQDEISKRGILVKILVMMIMSILEKFWKIQSVTYVIMDLQMT